MAYVDSLLRDRLEQRLDLSERRHRVAPAPLFGRLEAAVISLARTEPVSHARAPSRLRRLLGRLFCLPPANMLADERLEVLRQAVIVARRQGRAAAEALLPRLVEHGYSSTQATAILAEAGQP